MRKWDKLLPPKAAALRRHVESVATERNDIVALWLLCRHLQRELYRVSGVLSMVDVREHLRAQDAWRAQRERLKHGIDIAALFTEDADSGGVIFPMEGEPTLLEIDSGGPGGFLIRAYDTIIADPAWDALTDEGLGMVEELAASGAPLPDADAQ